MPNQTLGNKISSASLGPPPPNIANFPPQRTHYYITDDVLNSVKYLLKVYNIDVQPQLALFIQYKVRWNSQIKKPKLPNLFHNRSYKGQYRVWLDNQGHILLQYIEGQELSLQKIFYVRDQKKEINAAWNRGKVFMS